MKRQYKNPPIKEAVCEFRFASGATWDMAVPGLIYAELRADFPRRLQNVVQTTGIRISAGHRGHQRRHADHQQRVGQSQADQRPIRLQIDQIHRLDTVRQPGQPEITTQVDERFREDISQLQGLRFWREETEDGLIVVAPNKLAISQYPPYPSWDGFNPIIQQAFNAYSMVAQPKGVERIGLRYINDITFELETVELGDYFEFFPKLGPNLPQDFTQLRMSLVISFNDNRDALRLQLLTSPEELDEHVRIRLDLDYYLLEPDAVPLERVSDWLQQAHDNLEEVFEGCLKEAVRVKFDQEVA